VNKAKDQGLQTALAAIGNTVRNISDIYENTTGEGLNRADIGRIDPVTGKSAYEKESPRTGRKNVKRKKPETPEEKKKRERKKRTQGVNANKFRRDSPDIQLGTVVSRTSTLALSVETDIANRTTGKKREGSLNFHMGNSPQKKVLSENPSSNLNRVKHKFEEAEYGRVMKDFSDNYSSNHYSMRRAFPTFKVLFVEENKVDGDNTGNGLITRLTEEFQIEDFYGMNAVKEIRVVKNKDMAADVCVIQVMDIDGILYNRSFLPNGSKLGRRKSQKKYLKSPFIDTVIKEGMKVVVSMGYENDPEQLETVFVGQVASFAGDSMVEIICQSYGSELVQQRFGSDYSENAAFWTDTTQTIIHDCLDREEVRHFGRWELADASPLGIVFGHQKLRPDGQVKRVWTWKPSVVDDNIFCPGASEYVSGWNRFWNDVQFVFYDTTIWEVMKEMELRHPGYVAYPVPYGVGAQARMTIFFGNPNMEYLYRPATSSSEFEQENVGNNLNNTDLRDAVIDFGLRYARRDPNRTIPGTNPGRRKYAVPSNDQYGYALGQKYLTQAKDSAGLRHMISSAGLLQVDVDLLRLALKSAPAKLKLIQEMTGGSITYAHATAISSDKFWKATMIAQAARMKMFRNYELVSDTHDIIENRIRTDHRDTFNSIELLWADNEANFQKFYNYDNVESLTVNADDNIKAHHIRRTQEGFPNCTTEDLARRYASQVMANSLKGTYKGHLMTIGRPKLKPYDFLWVYDGFTDMAGPVEINEIVHTISAETGMISEILPHMIVAVKEEVTTLGADAMGAFFTEHMKEYALGAAFGTAVVLTGGIGASAVLTTNTYGTAGVIGAGLGVEAAATGAALENSTEKEAQGFAAGLALGAGILAHPIAVPVAGIIAGNLVYKFLKYNLTREPIIVTPLIKAGKPFVTGLEGMSSDGLVVSDIFVEGEKGKAAFDAIIARKWRYFIDGFGEAAKIAQFGWASFIHS